MRRRLLRLISAWFSTCQCSISCSSEPALCDYKPSAGGGVPRPAPSSSDCVFCFETLIVTPVALLSTPVPAPFFKL